MSESTYAKDLSHIKTIMEQSTKFLSLSGKSGVFAGLLALGASFWAWQILYKDSPYFNREFIEYIPGDILIKLGLIALATLVTSIGFGIYFTHKKAQNSGSVLWTKSTWRLLEALMIPLSTGGVIALILIQKHMYGLVAPTTLIFYGLALVNASKFTLNDIKFLGICELILGLLGFYFIGYGLLFWALGFGILHIIYGAVMHFKYDRK